MARISNPTFRLFGAGITQKDFPKYDENQSDRFRTEGPKVPAGVSCLRWTHEADLGLPRQAFTVWRHREKFERSPLLIQRRSVRGVYDLTSGGEDLYRIELSVELAPGEVLRIQPIGRQHQLMPGTEIEVTADDYHVFTIPFLRGLRFTGAGTIVSARAIVQQDFINSRGWEAIQLVGFPFPKGSLPTNVYDTSGQGVLPTGLEDPKVFAQYRLMAGAYLHEPLPATLAGVPAWLAPDPTRFLTELARGQTGLLPLIQKCLEQSDDGAADPADRQPAYVEKVRVPGLQQAGFPGLVNDGEALVPVVGTTLLAAMMDKYAGLALGYGTYDTSPKHEGEQHFYMVTNTFTLRPYNGRIFGDRFVHRVEYAALVETLPRPVAPNLLGVEGMHRNRPLTRDGLSTEGVQLTFSAPSFPLAYGLVRQGPSGNHGILNGLRSAERDSYEPHIPSQSSPENASLQPLTYTVANAPLPVTGTLDYRYYLSAIDMFGRCSAFDEMAYQSRALAPQRPGLISVRLTHQDGLPNGTSANVLCDLEVTFSWDWAERTPGIIQLGGGYFPADLAGTPPRITDRFSVQSGNPTLPLIDVTFSPTGVPQVSGAGRTVVEVTPQAGADPDLRRYLLTVTSLVSVFPGLVTRPVAPPARDPSRVGFAVTIRALEQIRMAVTPVVWCEWSNPRTDRLDDPRPPAKLNLSADINWTALPDATRTARGKLSWPAVDRAVGYVIWEANETALRETLGLPPRPDDSLEPAADAAPTDPLPNSLVARATELATYLNDPANDRRSLRAFVRLNRDPLRATSTEVALPGAAEVLYVYRVSAMTVANVESERSNVVFFAVPKQQIPGPPRLKLNVHQNGTSGIKVTALRGGGVLPAGYRVYRVRKQLPNNVVQMKGLPIIREDAPGWVDHEMRSLDGKQVTNGMEVIDPLGAPSWKPYYYQLVAVGAEDLANGLYKGVSSGSPTEHIHYPPLSDPGLRLLGRSLTYRSHFIRLTTDAPLYGMQLGESELEVFRFAEPSAGKIAVREKIFGAAAGAIKRVERKYRPNRPALPDLSVGPEVVINDDREEIYLRLLPTDTRVIVRITDPLGRFTELIVDAFA
jgi:hypothetical protein